MRKSRFMGWPARSRASNLPNSVLPTPGGPVKTHRRSRGSVISPRLMRGILACKTWPIRPVLPMNCDGVIKCRRRSACSQSPKNLGGVAALQDAQHIAGPPLATEFGELAGAIQVLGNPFQLPSCRAPLGHRADNGLLGGVVN